MNNTVYLQIIMDNGPARKLRTAQTMQEAGDRIGDPFEISTIRRDVSCHYFNIIKIFQNI